MLTEVLKALVHQPENLEVQFHEHTSTVLVQITAHPNDARIIVGQGRSHLSAVEVLARLLFHYERKLVQFMPVESWEDEPMLPQKKFVADPNWPEEKYRSLLTRLAQTCFKDAKVEVESRQLNEITQRFTVKFDGRRPNDKPLMMFASAIAILFVPVGSKSGRLIHADVEKQDANSRRQ